MGLVANAIWGYLIGELERETGFEPAIFCMASRRSTAELLPLVARVGIEPTSQVFQTRAVTNLATSPDTQLV